MIEKGQDWGEEVDRPDGLVVAATDAELGALVAASGADGPPLGLVGGDLLRTLGGASGGPTMRRVPLDVVRVTADDADHLAVAHVVARSPWWRGGWWRGRAVAICNSEHRGRWDLSPRGHPNDGRVEVLEIDAAMGLRARWQAWRRLPTGTHLPHPAITTSSRRGADWHFERRLVLVVDGRPVGRVGSLRVTVDPDAYQLHV